MPLIALARYPDKMITSIVAIAASWIKSLLACLGYGGVLLAMGIGSACIPLPSEIVMPAAGVLVVQGAFNFHVAAAIGALGDLCGSLLSYFVGVRGGRPFLVRYGRYLLFNAHDLDKAERFFERFGNLAVLIGRCLPIVRSFISLPAGIARMPLWRFATYTFVGSWVWSNFLLLAGVKLGQNLGTLQAIMHRFDLVVGFALLAGFTWWCWRHLVPTAASEPS